MLTPQTRSCALGGALCLAREMMEVAQEPLAVLDPEGVLLAANEAFHLALGLSHDRTAGRPLAALGGGEWATGAVASLLARARRGEVVHGAELVLESASAGRRRLVARARAIREGENRVALLLVSFREAPAEESAAAAAALEALAGRHAADLVALVRPDGRCAHLSGAAAALLGYPVESFRGVNVADFLAPEELARLRERLPEAVRAGEPLRMVVRVRRRHAAPLPMEALVRAVRAPGHGRLLHVALRDVSERERAERALRFLARQSRLVLETASEGIFGTDTAGRITFVNPAAARLLGQPADELLGRPCAEVFVNHPPGSRVAIAAAVEKTLRHGISYSSPEAQVYRTGGSTVPVEYTSAPMRDGERVVGAVVSLRDISEQLRAQAVLRRSEWLTGVGETVTAIRHEVNNPLTTLLAEASLLEMGGNSPLEERESITAMIQEARRIGDVLRRLAQRQHDPGVRFEGSVRMLDLM